MESRRPRSLPTDARRLGGPLASPRGPPVATHLRHDAATQEGGRPILRVPDLVTSPTRRTAVAPACARGGGKGEEVFHLPPTMDNSSDVGHENLDYHFDEDDMFLNENQAPRPSEVNYSLTTEHGQSVTGLGSSNDEDLESHLSGSDDNRLGDGDMSSRSNLPANREHDGGDVQNDAKEDFMDSLDNAAYSRMLDDAERNNSLHEFCNIIKKTFASEEDAYIF